MNYRLIDRPHFVPESEYREALSAMTGRLSRLPETMAVYQVGGISAPGISDLDMIVVFRDNKKVEENFHHHLSSSEKYLFIHSLYGISESDFAQAERYTFFNNFVLLYGQDLQSGQRLPQPDTDVLKKQVAIEYLVKMCINIYLQQSYRVLRVRDLLLHVKALQYDCDFLGIHEGRLLEKISQIIEWRKTWFDQAPAKKEIIKWWNEFYEEFELFLESLFSSHTFYLPPKSSYSITKNISVVPSPAVSFSRQGFVLPGILSLAGKRYFNLQNKFNRFRFEIPVSSENIPAILQQKFSFEKTHVAYNRTYLPKFFTLSFALHYN
jgi:hypothetical protein